MKSSEVLRRIKLYFKAYELVGPEVYAKYGEDSFQFMNIMMLETLLFIREELGLSITINDWHWGGIFSQRGHRANTQEIVYDKTIHKRLYLSGHPLGMAIDFNVKGMTARAVINWLVANADSLPHKIRIEDDDVERVHIDIKYLERNPKVYLFKP